MSNWKKFVQRFSGFVSHPTRMKVKLLVSTLAPPHNEAPAWTKWRARGNKSELMEAKVVCPCRPTHITPTWMQANKPDSLHYPLNWFMSLPLNWFLPEKLFDCLFIYLFIFPPCLLLTGCDPAFVRKRVAVQRMIYYLAKSEIKSRLRRRSCGICQRVGIH